MKFSDQIIFIDITDKNIGYAASLNRGIGQGLSERYDVFICANPDISVNKIYRQDILSLLANFQVGGFGFYQKRKICYGGILDKLRLSGGLNYNHPNKKYLPCDFVSGSFMVIKKEVIEKVGLFDESYFMYYEDVDFCFRAKRYSFSVGIDTTAF